MTEIYYGISGEEQWVVIDEISSEKSVDRLKELIKRSVVVLERISTAFLWFNTETKVFSWDANTPYGYFQIHATGDDIFELDISCRDGEGRADTVAIAKCLILLGFHLDENQAHGIFETHQNGDVSLKFTK